MELTKAQFKTDLIEKSLYSIYGDYSTEYADKLNKIIEDNNILNGRESWTYSYFVIDGKECKINQDIGMPYYIPLHQKLQDTARTLVTYHKEIVTERLVIKNYITKILNETNTLEDIRVLLPKIFHKFLPDRASLSTDDKHQTLLAEDIDEFNKENKQYLDMIVERVFKFKLFSGII